jgi:hypothetical protein
LTIEALLNGAAVDMPPQSGTFKQAPRTPTQTEPQPRTRDMFEAME